MTATAHDSVDFDHFHRKELPRRLATGNGPLAERAVERAGPLCFRLPDGAAWTYAAGPEGIDVVPGDAGAETLVELDLEAWRGLVTDIESAPGLLYAGRVRCVRGDPLRFVRWEPIWRAMFHGRPLYDPERHPLHDRDGSPLDPSRTFQIDDDRDELAHFLRETGYLLVRDVFRRDEVEGLLGVAHQVRAEAVPGDKRSWWGKNTRGEEVLCRVTHAGEVPELRALYEDARIRRIARLADAPLTPRAMGSVQGVTVLFKNPDMAEGLSDLPFHRDCGMGGHAIMCPTLIFTICLTSGSPEAGELRMLPGSWKRSYTYVDARDPKAPRGVGLDAHAGDVSVHYSDIMHAAPPPSGQGPFRVSLLLAFVPPGARPHTGGQSYNDVLLSREDGQVEHLADVAKRS
jgi:ectoine hydroxylase-related dioxygenase (phytanoyl-CoA dioxygenase family)